MGLTRRLWVDDATHRLHFMGQIFPCDRDIEAALPWQEYALLLSSDTDSLSLWDGEGLVRLTKVGVYPQDMAVRDSACFVCGGADGKIHLLHLPDLSPAAEFPVPGMPERICLHEDAVFFLTLQPEPEVYTSLLLLSPADGCWTDLYRFSGIPEGLAADKSGLWIAVSEGTVRLRWEDIRS